jgi:hypothetical protein
VKLLLKKGSNIQEMWLFLKKHPYLILLATFAGVSARYLLEIFSVIAYSAIIHQKVLTTLVESEITITVIFVLISILSFYSFKTPTNKKLKTTSGKKSLDHKNYQSDKSVEQENMMYRKKNGEITQNSFHSSVIHIAISLSTAIILSLLAQHFASIWSSFFVMVILASTSLVLLTYGIITELSELFELAKITGEFCDIS